MVEISAELVKQLRTQTGAGMMDCKKALAESGGDMEKAVEFLRKKGLATAQKRAGRQTNQGVVQSYIHLGGKLGVMVEINCETDFVAKSDAFLEFAKNIAMHIAAANPLAVRPEEVPADIMAKEREIYMAQARETGKPEKVLEKIVDGKVSKFLKDVCLMNQQYVRNPDITITDYMHDLIAKTGESVTIRRFVRYQLGE